MKTPDIISADGTVWTFYRAGTDPIRFDVDGTDLSGKTVVFKVAGGPTVTMVDDPENPAGKMLVMSLTDLAALPAQGADFYIRDEASGQVLHDGKVYARGFA